MLTNTRKSAKSELPWSFGLTQKFGALYNKFINIYNTKVTKDDLEKIKRLKTLRTKMLKMTSSRKSYPKWCNEKCQRITDLYTEVR